jgi:hypothetical protein
LTETMSCEFFIFSFRTFFIRHFLSKVGIAKDS